MSGYIPLIKAGLALLLVAFISYKSYDYGVIKTKEEAQRVENALIDKMITKEQEAYKLSLLLANQKPIIETKFKTITNEVIKYVQKNNDSHCVTNDADWLRLRTQAIEASRAALQN